MRPDEVERRLRERLDALGPAPRAELLHVLMLPDFERADRIGEFLGLPGESRLRRALDRLRGGPCPSGGARRDAAGGRALGSKRTMTTSTFIWIVMAGRGHSSEQLGRSFTEDLDDAKAKVNEHAERLRGEGRTDWFGAVYDLDRPTIIAPPGSTQPMVAWERVYFVDGRG